MRTPRSDPSERIQMTPDSREPQVSTEVQDRPEAAVTSWDDISPQLTETRELEVPAPQQPVVSWNSLSGA